MALEPAHQMIARLHRSVLWGTVSVRMYVFTSDFPTLSVRILMEGITNSIHKMQKREREGLAPIRLSLKPLSVFPLVFPI